MTKNNDFNNTENERYCVRAGYWHNYTGIGRCEDENLTTNEVCDLINEQNETITRLEKENEQLKHDATVLIQANQDYRRENEQLKQQINKLESQLYCPFDSICIQCNNEYLVQTEKYYVSKCKKGHEQCSKVDVKYCDDFELKGDVE